MQGLQYQSLNKRCAERVRLPSNGHSWYIMFKEAGEAIKAARFQPQIRLLYIFYFGQMQ